MAGILLQPSSMPDMMALARLHAALDSVLEAEEQLAQLNDSAATLDPALARAGRLVQQAREALRGLLRPGLRQGVGTAG